MKKFKLMKKIAAAILGLLAFSCLTIYQYTLKLLQLKISSEHLLSEYLNKFNAPPSKNYLAKKHERSQIKFNQQYGPDSKTNHAKYFLPSKFEVLHSPSCGAKKNVIGKSFLNSSNFITKLSRNLFNDLEQEHNQEHMSSEIQELRA